MTTIMAKGQKNEPIGCGTIILIAIVVIIFFKIAQKAFTAFIGWQYHTLAIILVVTVVLAFFVWSWIVGSRRNKKKLRELVEKGEEQLHFAKDESGHLSILSYCLLSYKSLKEALALMPKSKNNVVKERIDDCLTSIQSLVISCCAASVTEAEKAVKACGEAIERDNLAKVLRADFCAHQEIMDSSTIEKVNTMLFDLEEYVGELNRYEEEKAAREAERQAEAERLQQEREQKIFEEALRRLDYVDRLDGYQFEEYVAEILRRNGYKNVIVTKSSNDQGADVLATKDLIKYAFQCKHYATKLGNTPVQEVATAKDFYKCHVGIVVTNNYFTPGAVELAKAVGVVLWDRDYLASMIAPKENFSEIPNAKESTYSTKDKAVDNALSDFSWLDLPDGFL